MSAKGPTKRTCDQGDYSLNANREAGKRVGKSKEFGIRWPGFWS